MLIAAGGVALLIGVFTVTSSVRAFSPLDVAYLAGYGIETTGVLVIIAGSVVSSIRFLSNFRKEAEGFAYGVFRPQ